MAVSVPAIGHSLVWLVRDLWPPKQMSCIIISSMGTPSAGWHIICHRCQHNAIRIFLISSQLVLLFHNFSQLSQLFTTVLFYHFLAKHNICTSNVISVNFGIKEFYCKPDDWSTNNTKVRLTLAKYICCWDSESSFCESFSSSFNKLCDSSAMQPFQGHSYVWVV